jgi:uncharacterized protein
MGNSMNVSATKIIGCVIGFLALSAAAGVDAADGLRGHGPATYASAAHIIPAAERGNVNAEAQLGWMYLTGRGVPQDFFKAAKWYYLAAVHGHGGAQFQLGLLYNKGLGVPVDYTLSYMWLNLSASQAVGDDRDFKVRVRDAVASKMTVAQVALAQHIAMTWYKTR